MGISIGSLISSSKNELVRRMDLISEALPLPGSEAARFAGFAACVEGAVFYGGTIGAMGGAGGRGWLSAWIAESLGQWTDSTRPGQPAFLAAEPIRILQRLGTRFGARDGQFLLTAVVQSLLGAALSLTRRSGNCAANVAKALFWEGLIGGLSAFFAEWAMFRLDVLSGTAPEFEPLLPLMMRGGIAGTGGCDLRIQEEMLPASKVVEDEHQDVLREMPQLRATFDYCSDTASKALDGLIRRLGLEAEVRLSHSIYLMPNDTKYWPMKPSARVRHRVDSDEGGISFVRYRAESFAREFNELRIFSMCRELARADLSLHHIIAGQDVTLIDGVRRARSAEREDPVAQAREQKARRFNRITSHLIAHVATGFEQPGSVEFASESKRLIAYYRELGTETLRDDFLRAVIRTRMAGDFEPMADFFAHASGVERTAELALRVKEDLLELRLQALPRARAARSHPLA
jgi:hypothetical protein